MGFRILLAAGLALFGFLGARHFDFRHPAQLPPPKNIAYIAAGEPVAACGSSSAVSTCVDGRPVMDFGWVDGGSTDGIACTTAVIDLDGQTIAKGLACTGAFRWTGAYENAASEYVISYENTGHVIDSGTISTPLCNTEPGNHGTNNNSPGPGSSPGGGGQNPPGGPTGPGSGVPLGGTAGPGGSSGAGAALPGGGGVALPQCSDGLDNDGDGTVDYITSKLRASRPADSGCASLQDNSERNPPGFIEIPPQ